MSPSATLAVDAKAKALKAAGEHVIGFGAGEPDFPTPAHIVEAAVAACRDPANHHYTPTAGLPALREAIAAKTKRDSGFEVTAGRSSSPTAASRPSPTRSRPCATRATRSSCSRRTGRPTPSRSRLAGGTPVYVRSDETTGFRSSVDDLEAAWTPNTKALLFVSPSNPTGAVYPREEIEAIGRWAVGQGDLGHHRRDLRAPHLRRGRAPLHAGAGARARRPLHRGQRRGQDLRHDGLARRLDDRPGDAVAAATNIQCHETSNVSNVAQRAALAAVSGGLEDVAAMREAFDIRRRTIVKMLNEIDGVDCPEPEGAFYAFPSSRGCSGDPSGANVRRAALELAEICINEAKVAVVPGEAFGAPGFFRMSYAMADDDMVEGVEPVGCALRRGARLSRLADRAGRAAGAAAARTRGGGSKETTRWHGSW